MKTKLLIFLFSIIAFGVFAQVKDKPKEFVSGYVDSLYSEILNEDRIMQRLPTKLSLMLFAFYIPRNSL
ncbi:hypothetical protein SAMN04487898_104133 [Pedobacter sp. ok626]|uniref:hypothetical protein n=1 Tax=Pedobacter sp. ok626 TaxID=1761882 RepID=UPI000882B516|nr:hypothetical protein [Pedobacter sp. ok626]SDJ73620.1 hypothetical protein SAMN04487898_104133 [Pedobacter sp. ok626]